MRLFAVLFVREIESAEIKHHVYNMLLVERETSPLAQTLT